MKNSRLILCLFFLIWGCDHPVSHGFRFEEEKELKGVPFTAVSSDSVSLRFPFRVRRQDSLLYVLDLHGRDDYCARFSFPDIELQKAFAPRGDGPEEYASIENIRICLSGKVFLLDANKKTISIYDPEEERVCNRIKLPKELIRTLDFAPINDSLFILTDYTGKCRVHIMDDNGKIRKQLFHIPTKKKKDHTVSDIVMAQAWRSFIDYNPRNGILAMATQLGQVIEIYDLKTQETVNIVYGDFDEPQFACRDSYAIPDGIMGYGDIHVGDNAIYTLFWGNSFKEIQKDPFNTPQGGNIIQVFSLDGKPIKQYVLDRHITGFSFDEKNGKMIALDVNSDHQIIEYQLSSNSTK